MSFLPQGVQRKNKKIWTIITNRGQNGKKRNSKEITTICSQHSETTKPPTMVIERESNKFLLQPRKGYRLYFVHYVHNRVIFDVENSVIYLFPYFPNNSQPNCVQQGVLHLRSTTTKNELSIMIRDIERGNHVCANPTKNTLSNRTKKRSM